MASPLPSFYRPDEVDEESTSTIFRYYSEIGFSLHHHLYFKIFSLNINNIRNENYYNKN